MPQLISFTTAPSIVLSIIAFSFIKNGSISNKKLQIKVLLWNESKTLIKMIKNLSY